MVKLVDVSAAELGREAKLVLTQNVRGSVSHLAGHVVTAGRWCSVLQIVEARNVDTRRAGKLRLRGAGVEAERKRIDVVVGIKEKLVEVVHANSTWFVNLCVNAEFTTADQLKTRIGAVSKK